jgi:hypothetical protein
MGGCWVKLRCPLSSSLTLDLLLFLTKQPQKICRRFKCNPKCSWKLMRSPAPRGMILWGNKKILVSSSINARYLIWPHRSSKKLRSIWFNNRLRAAVKMRSLTSPRSGSLTSVDKPQALSPNCLLTRS